MFSLVICIKILFRGRYTTVHACEPYDVFTLIIRVSMDSLATSALLRLVNVPWVCFCIRAHVFKTVMGFPASPLIFEGHLLSVTIQGFLIIVLLGIFPCFVHSWTALSTSQTFSPLFVATAALPHRQVLCPHTRQGGILLKAVQENTPSVCVCVCRLPCSRADNPGTCLRDKVVFTQQRNQWEWATF